MMTWQPCSPGRESRAYVPSACPKASPVSVKEAGMHAYLVASPATPLVSPASPRSGLIQDMLDAVGKAEINTRKFWRNPKLKALAKENEALKGKKDYVTKEVDERNQQIIFGHLATKYPQTEKFGEELGQDRSN